MMGWKPFRKVKIPGHDGTTGYPVSVKKFSKKNGRKMRRIYSTNLHFTFERIAFFSVEISTSRLQPAVCTLKVARPIPAVSAQFMLGNADGIHEIRQLLINQGCQTKPLADALDHFKIFVRVR